MAALREIAAHFGVSFDDKALKDGGSAIDGMVDKLKGFAGAIGAGVAAGAIYHFIGGLSESADALNKQSRSLGLSIGELQSWNYAADLSGVSAETLTGVLAKLGGGKFDKGLAALGVATKDAGGEARNATDLLDDVAENLLKIQNPAERNRKAVDVLGKSYVKMMPLLEGGADGLKKMREEFAELGGGFSPEFAKQSEDFDDNMLRLKTQTKSFAINIVGQVLPSMLAMSKWFVETLKPVIAFVTHTKILEAGMAGLAIKGVLLLSSKVGGLGGALKLLAGKFFTVLLPMLLIEDAFVFLSGGDSMIGRMIDRAFGKGTQDKVRKFFTDLDAQSKMSLDPKAGFGANLVATGLLMGNVFAQGISSADNFYRVLDGVWRGIVLGANIACEILRKQWASVGAAISDAVTDPMRAKKNADIEAAAQAQEKFTGGQQISFKDNWYGGRDEVLTPTPMTDQQAAFNKKRAAEIRATKEKSQSEINDEYSAQQSQKLVAEYDRLAAQLDPKTHTPQAVAESTMRATGMAGPPPPPGHVTTTTTVTNVIPPGTPADQIKAVNAASAAGVDKGLKATQAALVPGGVK